MVKRSENHSKKKSERKKVRKSCIANKFAGKKVMTFFNVVNSCHRKISSSKVSGNKQSRDEVRKIVKTEGTWIRNKSV